MTLAFETSFYGLFIKKEKSFSQAGEQEEKEDQGETVAGAVEYYSDCFFRKLLLLLQLFCSLGLGGHREKTLGTSRVKVMPTSITTTTTVGVKPAEP